MSSVSYPRISKGGGGRRGMGEGGKGEGGRGEGEGKGGKGEETFLSLKNMVLRPNNASKKFFFTF